MASAIEADANGHVEDMTAANAARSAMHAAGLALRGGREHGEETTRAIHLAAEVVRTVLRLTRLTCKSAGR